MVNPLDNIGKLTFITIFTIFISACPTKLAQFNQQDQQVQQFNKNNNQDIYAKVTPNGKFPWLPDWNVFLSDAIDDHGTSLTDENNIPADQMNSLCPGFFGASVNEKKAVWALFFASISRFESGFDPNSRYQEGSGLNYIYSEGLLQLSYGDEKHHNDCKIDNNLQNILDPKVNLQCGVSIMRDQLKVRKVIFTNTHYYWSVLTNKKSEITAFFKKHVDQLPFCNK